LPDEYKSDVRRKLQNAYSMAGYTEAKRALDQLHRDGPESQRGAQLGGRHGGDAHGAQTARARSASPNRDRKVGDFEKLELDYRLEIPNPESVSSVPSAG
jgi:hypothetical protein